MTVISDWRTDRLVLEPIFRERWSQIDFTSTRNWAAVGILLVSTLVLWKATGLRPAAAFPATALGADCSGAATLEARQNYRCGLGQETPTRVCTVAVASDNIPPPRRLSMADSSAGDSACRCLQQEPTLLREQRLVALANVAAQLPVSVPALCRRFIDLRSC